MNENLETLAKKVQKETATLEAKLELAMQMYQDGKEDEAVALLQEATVLAQKVTVRHREMLVSSGNPSAKADLEQIIAEAHPMRIGFTPQGWFGIQMEPLAKCKDTASKEYIRGIIYPAMRKFFADKGTVHHDKCTVVFRHVYDENLPDSRMRDYDNVEVKMVTDTVAMYVMVDDSPAHCRVFHCSAPGADAHTEVYVIPQDEFIEWVKLEDSLSDEGLPLTDQVPDRWKMDI